VKDPLHRLVPLRQRTPWSQTLHRQKSNPITTPIPKTINPPSPSASQPSLPPRRMHDSYSQSSLPPASSPELFEHYTNASGSIRLGKLLEHLDSLAGSIAYKHMLGPDVQTLGEIDERGFYIVTAAVDRLDLLHSELFVGGIEGEGEDAGERKVKDIVLSGHVVYVGFSSMEVVVKMETPGDGKTLMLGRFSMVCREAGTHRAKAVYPLVSETDEERMLYRLGEEHQKARKAQVAQSLMKTPPSSAEAAALHEVYLESVSRSSPQSASPPSTASLLLTNPDSQEVKPAPPGSVTTADARWIWIGETKQENTMIMFPQERNVHSKIFGGYLMRLAYELAYTDAILFTRFPVRFLSLDGISFRKPVPIGSILSLTSHVTCTQRQGDQGSLVHVVVQADVVDPSTGSKQTTNDFRFTWGSKTERNVAPRTYEEAIMWLEGRRALALGASIRDLRWKV